MNTTKNKIEALQSQDEREQRAAKIIAGIITGILAFGFIVYASRTVFLYVTSHHI